MKLSHADYVEIYFMIAVRLESSVGGGLRHQLVKHKFIADVTFNFIEIMIFLCRHHQVMCAWCSAGHYVGRGKNTDENYYVISYIRFRGDEVSMGGAC